jgi:hypothetical protein
VSTSTALIIAQVTSSTDVTCAAEISYAGDVGSADQFTGIIPPTVSGTYSYTVRFDGNWGATSPHST